MPAGIWFGICSFSINSCFTLSDIHDERAALRMRVKSRISVVLLVLLDWALPMLVLEMVEDHQSYLTKARLLHRSEGLSLHCYAQDPTPRLNFFTRSSVFLSVSSLISIHLPSPSTVPPAAERGLLSF